MVSKSESCRPSFFAKWRLGCSRKADRSSSTTHSPALLEQLKSLPEVAKASVGMQTDAPASTLASTQTDPEAEVSSLGTSGSARAAATKPAENEVKAFGDLRAVAEVEALRAENTGIHMQMTAKEREHKTEVAGLLEELEKHREACTVRSDKESERFHYVLACNGQEGSVPRSVLASAPDSLLYKMYSGEWDYARDEKGRALITCHPQRWAAVLEHLATGAIPTEPDPLLLAQARHWNLQRLVDGLEALVPGVTVTNDADLRGFKARCTFVSVMEKLSSGKEALKYVFPGPQSRWWAVEITIKGATLGSVVPLTVPSSIVADLKGIKLRTLIFRLLLRSQDIVLKSADEEFACGEVEYIGNDWVTFGGYGLQQILSEPLPRAPDSLVIEVEARY